MTKSAMGFPTDILEDEALFAGYVDSGFWALEQWLGSFTRLRQHVELSQDDQDEE